MRSPDNVETSGVCYKRVDEIGGTEGPKRKRTAFGYAYPTFDLCMFSKLHTGHRCILQEKVRFHLKEFERNFFYNFDLSWREYACA